MAADAFSFSILDQTVLANLHKLSTFAQHQTAVRALLAGALPIQNAAKQKAPKLTGTLSRSIHSEESSEGGGLASVMVGTDVVYAAIHEFGGVIVPKQAKLLHFVINGEDIFAKSVQIPARPYLRPALAEQKAAAIEATSAALRDLLRAQFA